MMKELLPIVISHAVWGLALYQKFNVKTQRQSLLLTKVPQRTKSQCTYCAAFGALLHYVFQIRIIATRILGIDNVVADTLP